MQRALSDVFSHGARATIQTAYWTGLKESSATRFPYFNRDEHGTGAVSYPQKRFNMMGETTPLNP